MREARDLERGTCSMRKSILWAFVLLFCAVTVVMPLHGAAEARTYRVNIATATTGGAYYPIGNAMAQIWTKKLDGVKAAAQSTAGTPQNVELLMNSEVQIAFGQNGVCFYAFNGKGVYEGKPGFPFTDIRGVLSLYPNVMHFIALKDAGVTSIADFKGKKIVPGQVASATEINTREILGIYGLNYMKDAGETNVNADFVGYNEAVDLLKNRQAQGTQIAGGVPTAAVLDLLSSGEMVLVDIEEEKAKEIAAKYPWYFPYTIKAGTYPNQDKDVHTVALANILFTRADVPDELIYMLTKAVYDYHEDLVRAHKATEATTLENAMNGMTIPVHPGAVKYFEEQGIAVPDIKPAQ
jgi:hypothetical protein